MNDDDDLLWAVAGSDITRRRWLRVQTHQHSNQSRVRYVEGVEKLREEIHALVSTIETGSAMILLDDVLNSVPLSPKLLIEAIEEVQTLR